MAVMVSATEERGGVTRRRSKTYGETMATPKTRVVMAMIRWR